MGTYSFSGAPVFVTVDATGIYDINAFGAQGGSGGAGALLYAGGNGAEETGAFPLTQGEMLKIVVGGQGAEGALDATTGNFTTGGGGGETLVSVVTPGGYTPLIVAGGGGGSSGGGDGGLGQVSTSTGTLGSGAGTGYGGSGTKSTLTPYGYTRTQYNGGGGAGFREAGTSGSNFAGQGGSSGPSYTGGSAGSQAYGVVNGGAGGFGGGGGSALGGGGGGGYTGGDGGYATLIAANGLSLDDVAGTGGTSFVFTLGSVVTAETMAGVQTGNGSLTITPSVACYCRGTLILTNRGEMPVEILAIGDTVVTASGEHRPVRWVGRRSYAGRFLAANPGVQPIRFRVGSLGDGLPRRDLLVSPKHAMFLGGFLISAECLVNGVTVVVDRSVMKVDYFHVELEAHDVLLAEGAPSESFVDDNSRGMFHNVYEHAALFPDYIRVPAIYCAPRIEDGYALEAIRRVINLRVGLLLPSLQPLHGHIDG